MNSIAQPANPGLRYRIPIYPVQFLCAMAIVSVGALLHAMMTDLGVPLDRGGLVSAGLFVGNVSGIVILNTVLARVSAKTILVGGTALQGMSLAGAGLGAFDLWSLFVIYLVIGFSGALMNGTCWMWQAAHMRRNAATAALKMIMFFALAMMAVPLVVGAALDQGASWRMVLVVEGGLSLAVALVCAFLPLLDISGRQNVRGRHLVEVVRHNPGLLLGMVGAGFTYVGAEMTLNVWLPKFQIEVFGASETAAGFSVTLFWIGLIVGRLIMMPLSQRFPPSRLILICALTMAVFTVLVAVVPSHVGSLALTVGAGLGASASYGLIGSFSGRFPGWQASVASSLFVLSGGLGSITFPYIMGPLADATGFKTALAAVALPAVAYALLSLLIHYSQKKQAELADQRLGEAPVSR